MCNLFSSMTVGPLPAVAQEKQSKRPRWYAQKVMKTETLSEAARARKEQCIKDAADPTRDQTDVLAETTENRGLQIDDLTDRVEVMENHTGANGAELQRRAEAISGPPRKIQPTAVRERLAMTCGSWFTFRVREVLCGRESLCEILQCTRTVHTCELTLECR